MTTPGKLSCESLARLPSEFCTYIYVLPSCTCYLLTARQTLPLPLDPPTFLPSLRSIFRHYLLIW